MRRLHFYGLWLLVITLLTYGCPSEKKVENFPLLIRDYTHASTVDLLFYEADKLKYNRVYDDAEAAFIKILKNETLLKKQQIYALNQLVFIQLKMHKIEEAVRLFNRLTADTSSFSNQEYADYLYNRGVLHLRIIKPVQARRDLEAALSIYQKEYPSGHLRIALTWSQLAMHQVDFGLKAKEVNQIIETAFRFFYPKNKKDTLLYPYAEEINYSMSQYYRMGSRDYQAGFNHCELAERLIYTKGRWADTVLWARCLGVKGLLLRKEGEYNKADSTILLGLSLLQDQGKNSIFIQEMYRFLLVNAAWRSKADEKGKLRGDSLYKQYWNQLHLHLNKNKQAQTYILTTELEAYYCYYRRLDRKADCLNASLRFLDTLHTEMPSYRYYIEEVYNFLATLKFEDKEYDTALSYQLASFKTEIDTTISVKIKDWRDAIRPQFAEQRINPFFAFARAGSFYLEKFKADTNSIKNLVFALKLYEVADNMMSLSLTMGKNGVLSYQQEIGDAVYKGGLEAAFLAKKWAKKYPDFLNKSRILNLAFRFSERQKSFILFREDLFSNPGAEAFIRTIKKIAAKISKLRVNATKIEQFQELGRADFDYMLALNKLYDDSKQNFIQKIHTVEKIRSRLHPNQVLVQYKVFPNFTYAFAISEQGLFFDTIGNTPIIQQHVTQFLGLVDSAYRNFQPARIDSAKMMYGKFIKPFEKIIPSKDAELIIVPDRFLTDLPFEAFPIKMEYKADKWRKVKYLLHQHYIVYAPSWKIWQHHRFLKTLKKGHQAAFFTYSMDEKFISDWELQGAKEEGEALFNFLKTKPFIGSNCDAAELRRAYKFKLLHFCLHGKSNPKTLDANQLYFGIKNNSRTDSLNGNEIAEIDLKEKWAIISACQTGIGKNYAEGTYSLARAFLQAGCEFTISSLWEIRDRASSEILGDFYKHIQQGDYPWVALTKAKRNYINNHSESSPYVWAALIPTI